MYATQPQIKAYFQSIAAEFSLNTSAHFETEVVSARWLDNKNLWLLESRDLRNPAAPSKYWTCNYLITALGLFNTPKKIKVPGVDSFAGKEWHANAWPEAWETRITGKRVAVIGTGPSAGATRRTNSVSMVATEIVPVSMRRFHRRSVGTRGLRFVGRR